MQQNNIPPPKGWKFSQQCWSTTISFLQGLQWRQSPDTFISVYEVAWLHWNSTRSHPPETVAGFSGRFINTVNWIRTVWRHLKRLNVPFHPDSAVFLPRKGANSNQAFPSGTVRGARCFVPQGTLLAFAKFVAALPNSGLKANDWNRPYSSFI